MLDFVCELSCLLLGFPFVLCVLGSLHWLKSLFFSGTIGMLLLILHLSLFQFCMDLLAGIFWGLSSDYAFILLQVTF